MNKKVNRKINTNNGKFPLPDVEVIDVRLIFNCNFLILARVNSRMH